MHEITCSTCGRPVPGGDCANCRAATAIATPEHAERVKVTPPAASDGAFSAGAPPVRPVPDATVLAPPKEIATAAGCLLIFICTAVIFGSAVPIVMWRNRDPGLPLPIWGAIAAPLLLGGLCYGVGAGILRLLGIAIMRHQAEPHDTNTE